MPMEMRSVLSCFVIIALSEVVLGSDIPPPCDCASETVCAAGTVPYYTYGKCMCCDDPSKSDAVCMDPSVDCGQAKGATVSKTYDVPDLRTRYVDAKANLPKETLGLQWNIKYDEAATSVKLIVEGPGTLSLPDRLREGENSMTYIDLNYDCGGSGPRPLAGGCGATQHGCCDDGKMAALGPNQEGCRPLPEDRGDGSCEIEDAPDTTMGELPVDASGERKAKCSARGGRFAAFKVYDEPLHYYTAGFKCCGARSGTAAGSAGMPCLAQAGPCPVAKCAAPPSADCKAVEELVVVSDGGCCPKLCNFKAADGVSECERPSDAPPADSCGATMHGCCDDGETAARGPKNEGCPSGTMPPNKGIQAQTTPRTAPPLSAVSPATRTWPLGSVVAAAAAGVCLRGGRAPLSCAAVGLTLAAAFSALPARANRHIPRDLGGPNKCAAKTTLTLVLPTGQWAQVDRCGMLKQSACQGPAEASTRFAMRARCDADAAATVLEALVPKCAATAAAAESDCDQSPLQNCGLDGWCTPSKLASKPQCIVPDAVADTCLQSSMIERVLKGKLSKEAEAMVASWMECRPRVIAGRPFTTDSHSVLLANATWHLQAVSNGSWACTTAAAPAADEALARAWLAHGQHEHASVASFARFSLELLRFGAPPQLLRVAHAAAAEEVEHAVAAWGLAAHFAQKPPEALHVGYFPVETVALSKTIAEFAARTLLEGCIGESEAVARALYVHGSMDAASMAYGTVAMIARDETRHAALAWATLRWARLKGASVSAPARGSAHAEGNAEEDAMLRSGGQVSAAEAAEVNKLALKVWVGRWVEAVVHGEPLPDVAAMAGAMGSAVSNAAASVRRHVYEIEALNPSAA